MKRPLDPQPSGSLLAPTRLNPARPLRARLRAVVIGLTVAAGILAVAERTATLDQPTVVTSDDFGR